MLLVINPYSNSLLCSLCYDSLYKYYKVLLFILLLEMLMEMAGHLSCLDEPHPGDIAPIKPRPGIRQEKEKETLFPNYKKSKLWTDKK